MENKYSKKGIVALCSLVYFVSYFSRKDFAAVMEAMISEQVIEKAAAGLALTMLFIFYGVGQLISGYLGDRIKPSHLIAFGLTVTAACNLALPLISSNAATVILWGINGFAQAMLWPPIVKILSLYLNHEQYVSANLIVTTAAHIATILLYLYAPLCLRIMTWRAVFFTSSIIAILALLIFIFALSYILPKTAEKKNELKQIGEKSDESIFKIFKKTGILPILVCIIACGFLRDGIESWLPTLYSEAFNRDASESILVSVILPIFSIASITAIKIVHKIKIFNNEASFSAILFAFSTAIAIPLAFIININAVWARFTALLLTALICSAMHGINFLLISCVPGRFARFGKASTASGLTNSCVYVGAATATYGIALISDSLGWSATIIGWIIVSAVGALMVVPSYARYSKFLREDTADVKISR